MSKFQQYFHVNPPNSRASLIILRIEYMCAPHSEFAHFLALKMSSSSSPSLICDNDDDDCEP